jgi:RNA polymerase sigma-70 factor, ECF subfamily
MVATPHQVAIMPTEFRSPHASNQDALYEQIATDYAAPLARLARAYEADSESRQELLQEIHIALWRSLTAFNQRCSLRTWVYRVAHNIAATHIVRSRRWHMHILVSLDEIDAVFNSFDIERLIDETRTLDRLTTLIQQLKPPDREIIVLYLEGLAAGEIAEITGLSAGNIATKTHRIKKLLTQYFHTRNT